MRKRIKKICVIGAIGMMLVGDMPLTKIGSTEVNAMPTTMAVVSSKPIRERKYSVTLAKQEQEKLINRIYKHNIKAHPNMSKYEIRRAFISARNRMPSNKGYTMKEYYRRVAIILATMETETDFKKINCRNSDGTIDYGIMQVNTVVIPTIKRHLGSSIASGLKYNTSDNIEAGSYEVISLCYNKARKKHPNKTIWYTFAYYNRGLYFEQFKYNYNQANTRSQIFIKKYKRYFEDLR